MSGFVVGGGVHVFFAQIGDVLGIKLPKKKWAGFVAKYDYALSMCSCFADRKICFSAEIERVFDLIENIGNIHYPTLAISLSSMAVFNLRKGIHLTLAEYCIQLSHSIRSCTGT
ncbi:hypothetical protein COOONC_26802 [Cooperia oncophora]